MRVFRFQRGNFFFQFLDVHAVGSTDQNFSGTDGHGKILDLFGRKQINLIIYDQIRDAFFMKTVNQFKFFFAFSSRTVDNKNCDICFIQYLITFVDAERTKFTFIINTGSINDHDRAKWKQFHGLVDGIGGCSHNGRNNCEILSGYSIDNTGFTGIPFSEKTDMYPFRSGCLIHSHRTALLYNA